VTTGGMSPRSAYSSHPGNWNFPGNWNLNGRMTTRRNRSQRLGDLSPHRSNGATKEGEGA